MAVSVAGMLQEKERKSQEEIEEIVRDQILQGLVAMKGFWILLEVLEGTQAQKVAKAKA